MESISRYLGDTYVNYMILLDWMCRESTYAHTCVPVSGMIVKRTALSSRRTQATFPREESEAVSSGNVVSYDLAF